MWAIKRHLMSFLKIYKCYHDISSVVAGCCFSTPCYRAGTLWVRVLVMSYLPLSQRYHTEGREPDHSDTCYRARTLGGSGTCHSRAPPAELMRSLADSLREIVPCNLRKSLTVICLVNMHIIMLKRRVPYYKQVWCCSIVDKCRRET